MLGAICSTQVVEMMTNVTWSETLSVSYNSSMNYFLSGQIGGPIISLAINDIPMPGTLFVSYTFNFIIPTTNMTNYITATDMDKLG